MGLDTHYGSHVILLMKLWAFIKPILQLIIIAVILRWLFFSSKNAISAQLKNLTLDVPSFTTVFVIAALCLLPIMGTPIPETLGNIGLVIVGFYFGSIKQRGVTGDGDKGSK